MSADDITRLAQQIRAKAQSGYDWNVERDWEKVNAAEKEHWLRQAWERLAKSVSTTTSPTLRSELTNFALKRLDGGQ